MKDEAAKPRHSRAAKPGQTRPTRPNRIKPNQTKSNQIKPNQTCGVVGVSRNGTIRWGKWSTDGSLVKPVQSLLNRSNQSNQSNPVKFPSTKSNYGSTETEQIQSGPHLRAVCPTTVGPLMGYASAAAGAMADKSARQDGRAPEKAALGSGSPQGAISALRSRGGGANLILLCGAKSIE
jgi:hypothetical protein